MLDALLDTNIKKRNPSWPQTYWDFRIEIRKEQWRNRISDKETIICNISTGISITFSVPVRAGFDWVLENGTDFPVPEKMSVMKRWFWLKFRTEWKGIIRVAVSLTFCLWKIWFWFFIQKIRWSYHQTYNVLMR